MRFKPNYAFEQDSNKLRGKTGDYQVMYNEIKSDDPDIGGIECILDRTQADVDRVKELIQKALKRTLTPEEEEEFLQPLKGALNYADIDRIEANISTVQAVLANEVSVNLWPFTRDYMPRVGYFLDLLHNVEVLRNTGMILSTTPQVPQYPVNVYQDWNDIEQIIYDIYWYKRRFDKSFYYAGEVTAGYFGSNEANSSIGNTLI